MIRECISATSLLWHS